MFFTFFNRVSFENIHQECASFENEHSHITKSFELLSLMYMYRVIPMKHELFIPIKVILESHIAGYKTHKP